MATKRTARGVAYIKAHQSEYQRKFAISEKGRAKLRRHREWNRKLIRSAKDNPCVDCGKSYPYYVMHFDHVRGVKRFSISTRKVGITAILKEIQKCELVCANCHAVRTFKRKQHWPR